MIDAPLVWCDLETTGLRYENGGDQILEVAFAVTDADLNPIAAFEAVTDVAKRIPFETLNPFVQAMHLKNGLWVESLRSENTHDVVEAAVCDFLDRHVPPPADGKSWPPLAGAGVHFDRAFLRARMFSITKRLHYRNLDTSAFVESSRRFWPELHAIRPHVPEEQKIHRAYPDLLESIEALKWWRAHLGPVPAEVALHRSAGVDLLDASGRL